MNNLILLLYPIINVIVTGIFAGVVLRQYVQRHRLYQLYWAVALIMAFLATLAYVLMTVVQPTSAAGVLLFRLYYILGGALTSSWLGLGSIALVANARATRICFVVLCVLSVLAALFISIASLNMQQLSQVVGTPGTGILQPPTGAWLITTIVLNSLGTLALAGVAIYSGWKLVMRQGSSHLLWANVLILAGALIIAFAGTNARLGGRNIFWLIMTFGWIVFFIGVLLASYRRSRTVTPESGSQGKNVGATSSASTTP